MVGMKRGTWTKVRDDLKSYDEDPGWYQHPPGTVALKASDADLARDGIDVARWGASAPDGARAPHERI